MSTADLSPATPPFQTLSALIRGHAKAQPARLALLQGETRIDYATLDALMDRVAASLQRDGLKAGDAIAVCAHATPLYAVLFLGALRAGVAVAPLAPSVTPESFAAMLGDAQARRLFVDAAALDALGEAGTALHCIALDDAAPGTPFERWLMPEGSQPTLVEAQPRILMRGVPEAIAAIIHAEHVRHGVTLLVGTGISHLHRNAVVLADGVVVDLRARAVLLLQVRQHEDQ